MEYRGKRFTIVQGIGPDSWKWAVYLDEKTVKSGEAKTRVSAQTNAIWAIDKALAPKNAELPPCDECGAYITRRIFMDDARNQSPVSAW